jgi:hypothetical protein
MMFPVPEEDRGGSIRFRAPSIFAKRSGSTILASLITVMASDFGWEWFR